MGNILHSIRKHSAKWHRLPERGSLFGLKITLLLYRILGPRLIWLVIYPVLLYFFITGTAARNGSKKYLSQLHKRGVLTNPPTIGLQFSHFVHFAEALLDRMTIYLGKGNRFELKWHGREIIDAYLEKKRGVLLVGAHLGSFELLRLLADERDSEKVHALMYTKQAKIMAEIFRHASGREDLSVISLENLDLEQMLAMRDIIQKGEHIGILADRPAVSAEERVERVPFFGELAPFPVGPWQLASFLGAPTLLIFGIKTGRDRYEIFCEEFIPRKNAQGKIDFPATTATYAVRLEEYCAKYPLQWFNFYDYWRK